MPRYDNFNIKAVDVNKVLSKMSDKEKLFFLNHSNINRKIHLNKSKLHLNRNSYEKLGKNFVSFIRIHYTWSCFFSDCTKLLIFMGIIFCSSVALVWAFNTRCVYNFITKEANIPVNLVPFFNDVSFLFCSFLKSGVKNELKSIFL